MNVMRVRVSTAALALISSTDTSARARTHTLAATANDVHISLSLSLSLSLSRPDLNPNTLLPHSGSSMCVYVCQSVPPVSCIVNRQITTWDFVYVILNMWLNSNIQLTSYLLGLNKLN